MWWEICAERESKKRKKEKVVKKEELSERTKELLLVEHKPSPILTPKEHAKRIIGYGKDRAKALLFTAEIENRWKHVDWGKVEQRVRWSQDDLQFIYSLL